MSVDNRTLESLFESCSRNKPGYIDKEEFRVLSKDLYLTPGEYKTLLNELGFDQVGNISKREFLRAFRQGCRSSKLKRQGSRVTMETRGRLESANVRATTGWENFLGEMGIEFYLMSRRSQEQICELYQNLHSSESPDLLGQFEDIILSVIKDIRQQQFECEQLESSFKKEKEQHVKHLQDMEEELESQVTKVETRIRREEQEKLELEKMELKNQLEMEINDLKGSMKKVQQMEVLHRQEKPNDETRAKLDDLAHDNRFLNSQMTDAQTKLALLRSELATTKQVMEEKTYELQSEKHALMEYVKEQDNLTRQVHVLHDANKKLHDTNDDLRQALENSRTFVRRSLDDDLKDVDGGSSQTGARPKTTSTPMNRGEYVKQYLNSPASSTPIGGSSLADELSMIEGPKRKLLPIQDSCEIDSLPEDFDSGHSTMRDGHDPDSEYEPLGPEEEHYNYRKRSKLRRMHSNFDSTTESDSTKNDRAMLTSIDESLQSLGGQTDFELDMGEDDDRMSRCSNCSSKGSIRSSGSRRQGSVRRVLPTIPTVTKKLITKEPERMFKIVLAGDAAVGKSSFIMRLCKDKFVSNLSSTLGVDFQTKTIELDGRVIALQLWDTAGQERFRSIAKSYFRRADGVLLVYDCTYERSFINVRDWVETVQDSSSKNLPIMFVANKTDLREEFQNDGRNCIRCVEKEEGERLAREYDGLFIEGSAKSGDNIMEAVVELTRLMRANEDLEVQNGGMQLTDMNTKEKSKLVDCCTL